MVDIPMNTHPAQTGWDDEVVHMILEIMFGQLRLDMEKAVESAVKVIDDGGDARISRICRLSSIGPFVAGDGEVPRGGELFTVRGCDMDRAVRLLIIHGYHVFRVGVPSGVAYILRDTPECAGGTKVREFRDATDLDMDTGAGFIQVEENRQAPPREARPWVVQEMCDAFVAMADIVGGADDVVGRTFDVMYPRDGSHPVMTSGVGRNKDGEAVFVWDMAQSAPPSGVRRSTPR